ncbi:hypothetical protein [Ureaplasma urealyticum]|uniref:hypothetical protein n=1 Tax=Ureaplasma urealyticum TaxID=2130 RepID=UPI0001748CA5|nr:hypothetical protein [Ureaplasma urealyticum]EDU57206.1 conserved hypothetical protein [Ureaplasma urealyticum serovar 7 str. ATCC 27819]
MGLFSKKNKLNQELSTNQNTVNDEVSHDDKSIYQLYDETIVTKKVKVRCKVCGVFMWVDYTKTIKSLRNLALTNVQQEVITIEEPQVLEDNSDVLLTPVNDQEELVSEEYESAPIESIQEEQIVEDNEPIQDENEEITPPVYEVEEPTLKRTSFTPVAFEFEEPIFENIYSNQKVYAENLFLESMFSEKENLINDDQNDFSWLSKYVSVWNKRDEAELAQMVYDERLLAPEISEFTHNEYFIEEEYEHADPDNHHNKHKAQRHLHGHDLVAKKHEKQLEKKTNEIIDQAIVAIDSMDEEQQTSLKTIISEEEFKANPVLKKTWWETKSANKSSK